MFTFACFALSMYSGRTKWSKKMLALAWPKSQSCCKNSPAALGDVHGCECVCVWVINTCYVTPSTFCWPYCSPCDVQSVISKQRTRGILISAPDLSTKLQSVSRPAAADRRCPVNAHSGTHGSSRISPPHRDQMNEGQCPAPSCGEGSKCLRGFPAASLLWRLLWSLKSDDKYVSFKENKLQ